jgi:hypothetical protein
LTLLAPQLDELQMIPAVHPEDDVVLDDAEDLPIGAETLLDLGAIEAARPGSLAVRG